MRNWGNVVRRPPASKDEPRLECDDRQGGLGVREADPGVDAPAGRWTASGPSTRPFGGKRTFRERSRGPYAAAWPFPARLGACECTHRRAGSGPLGGGLEGDGGL